QASEDEIQAARNFPLALRRVCAAGEGGYWKIMGSSSKFYGKDENVRYKKSFNFYRGRPGRDEKTDWIMHEYIVQRGSGMVLRIALGSAKGILYLHNEADPPIFHRDIKASNILLNSDLMPRLLTLDFQD
ncbi:hypothetical protein IFM89_005875, partial [Coptis chinensis]